MRLLDLIEDYDISIFYYQGKANVVADPLSKLCMGSTTHVRKKIGS